METAEPSPLGSLLLSTRKRADLTQEALAARAGVSVNTISNLEAGRGHLPRLATIDLLVTALATALALAPPEQGNLRAAFREAAGATRAQRQAHETAHPARQPEVPTPPLLPTGTLTFLVCALLTRTTPRLKHPRALQAALPRLAARLQRIVPPRGGRLVDPPDGRDGAVCIFAHAGDALAAACALQQALTDGAAEPAMPVCLALHTGWAEPGAGDYAGATRRRAARLARMGHGGQVLLSQPSHDLVLRTLPEGLRLQEAGRHGLCAVERSQPIYQILQPTLPATFPPLRPPPTPPTNLPLQVTSFIGREREQAAVGRLLAQAPLVTLVGAGGCGKTRLALQVASDLLDGFPDGTWLVELAALSGAPSEGAPLVAQAVASALALREEPGRPLLATLLEALEPKHLLLVLDNCEHLVAACAELAAALLRRCPHLQILATSRERLAIRGESTYRVPSLSLPEPDRHLTAAALTTFEGVRLFVERARAGRPTFALTEENGRTVAAICARLDGIPLAIELAAARVGSLPVEAIAARMERSIEVLSGGPRDVLPRHQTLRAALDWSWELLGEQERALLRRLAVFAGGWRPGAAVAVGAGDGIEDWAVPDLLDGLTRKSLVGLDERDDTARYGLLETVRQYAWERLVASAEMTAVRDRHLAWCVALAEEAEGRLNGPEQGAWLARLDREHDNLRAALTWAREREAGDGGLRLAGALWRFWSMRGYLSEGRGWLEGALAAGEQRPDAVRARALIGAGTLAYGQGDYGKAVAVYEAALPLYRTLGDTRGIAASLSNLGNVAFQQDDYGRAAALYRESLALRRVLGDTWGVAASLGNLGNVAKLQGDHGQAAVLYGESLALQRTLGDTWGIATSLNNLGLVAERQGDYERAAALLEEALTLQRALGNKYGISRALSSLAEVAYQQGDYERAVALNEEALPLRRALGDTQGIAASLSCLGEVAYQQGDYGRAVVLHEEAIALRRTLGDTWGIATSLNNLGLVAERQGEYGRAAALLKESLLLSRAIGARELMAEFLESLAWVDARSQPQRAARLGGAAEALQRALGMPLPADERAGHDRAVWAMRAALGEEAFAAAWAEGRALSAEQAIALALPADRTRAE